MIPEIEKYHMNSEDPPELFRQQTPPGAAGSSAGPMKRPPLDRQEKMRRLRYAAVAAIVLFLFPARATVTGNARVVPAVTLTLEALTIGELQEIYRKEGDRVAPGEAIARIHNGDYQSELDQSLKEVDIIGKQIEQLSQRRDHLGKMLERNASLHEEQVIAITELEQTQLEHNQTVLELEIKQKRLEALKVKIAHLQEELSHSIVRAPIAGILVGGLYNKKGKWLAKGMELCQVFDPHAMLLELPVYERDVRFVRPGQKAAARFHAFGGRYRGQVTDIRPVAWEKLEKVWVKENVINVMIQMRDIPEGLKPGMSANVAIYAGWTVLGKKLLHKIGIF